MIRKITIFALFTLVSLSTLAGVRVTALDLRTSGANGTIAVSVDGRSQELPDVKVSGNTIDIILTEAESFKAISKTVRGAKLSADMKDGRAIIRTVLPYDVTSSGVNLNFKGKDIEVVFPRGKVAQSESGSTPSPVSKRTAAVKTLEAPAITASGVAKEVLNEDYLNKLMRDETKKTARRDSDLPPKSELKKDEVNLKLAAPAKLLSDTKKDPAAKAENFSFAGYAVKFSVFLALVLGLFYGIVQLLKKGVFNRGKLGFLNNAQMIQVLSTTYVAPKRSLMVVKAHNQIFLVANSENGIQFLSEMKDTSGLIKTGEKLVTGTNFDQNLGLAEETTDEASFKLKEDISESAPLPEEKGIQGLSAKDIVKFSDELKKKARKLKPIEFN